MKRIISAIIAIAICIPGFAVADSESDLVGLGVRPEVASRLSEGFNLSSDPAVIASDTVDAADSKSVAVCGGGAYSDSGARGACILLEGNESNAGQMTLESGSEANGIAVQLNGGSGDTFSIQNGAALEFWQVLGTGVLQNGLTQGGDITLRRSGTTIGIDSGTAASACKGTGTFNGTTAVTISTTCSATSMHVSLTPTSDPTGTTAAYCWVTSIVNGTSFQVDCDQANDGTFSWVIIKEG